MRDKSLAKRKMPWEMVLAGKERGLNHMQKISSVLHHVHSFAYFFFFSSMDGKEKLAFCKIKKKIELL